MPRDLFEELGIDPNVKSKQAQGRDLFEELGIQAKPVEPQISALQQILKGFGDIPQNLGALTRGAATSVINLPAQGANMVLPQNMQMQLLQGEQNPAFKTGNFIGDIAGFFGGGEVVDTARGAAEAAPYIGDIAKYLGGEGYGSTVGRVGLGSAGYGAATSPDDRTQGALIGALGGALGGAASKAIPDAISALSQTSRVKSMYSPEEIARNVEASRGTQTPLGDIIGSPAMKRKFDIELPKNEYSGAEEKMAESARQVIDKGNQMLGGYLGNTAPEQVNEKLGDALKQAFQQQQATKKSLYSGVEDLAKKEGLKLELPEFGKTAKKYTDLINDTNFLKFEPDSKTLINKLANYREPVKQVEGKILDVNGNPMTTAKYPSLQEANILSGKLNDLAKTHRASPSPEDRHMANVLGDMGKALKGDIRSSIEQSGSEDLQNAFSSAEENYKKNFSPFLDKDIYKFIGGNKSPDELISTFIKTGGNTDKSDQLSKLMTKLSPDDQNLVKYAYLSRALKGTEDNRTIDPLAFKNLWGDTKLGQNQKKSLIPDKDERRELENYAKLAGMNVEGLTRMFNPKTGYRALGSLSHAKEIGAAFGGYAHGGIPGAVIGALGIKAIGSALDKRMVNKLTDEGARTKFIQQMSMNKMGIKNKKSQIPLKLNAIIQALIAQQRQ